MAIYRGYIDSTDYTQYLLYPTSSGDSIIFTECDDEFLSYFDFSGLGGFDSFVSLKLYNDGNYKIELKYIYNNVLQTYTSTHALEDDFEYDLRQLFTNGDILFKGVAKMDISSSYLTDWEPVLKRNVNTYFLYTYSSPKIQVTKSLTFVKSGTIKFQNPITHRDLVISMVINANEYTFNYVYLSVLNRFYYIIDTSMMNDIASLTLHEDVLMSWDSLIRSQSAYVTRQQNNYDNDKVDDLVTYDYSKEIIYSSITYDINPYAWNPVSEPDPKNFVLTTVG